MLQLYQHLNLQSNISSFDSNKMVFDLQSFPRNATEFNTQITIGGFLNRIQIADWIDKMEEAFPSAFSLQFKESANILQLLHKRSEELYKMQSSINRIMRRSENAVDDDDYYPLLSKSHKDWNELEGQLMLILWKYSGNDWNIARDLFKSPGHQDGYFLIADFCNNAVLTTVLQRMVINSDQMETLIANHFQFEQVS